MDQPRAVTILAAVVLKLGRSFQAQIAGVKGKVLLRLPAGDVAAQTFRIEMAGDVAAAVRRLHERVGSLGMRCLRPNFERLHMTLATLHTSDELSPPGMRLR